MRVVIDTNVIVSAVLSSTGAPAHVLAYLEREAFSLLISEPILAEFQRALSYTKVRSRHGMSSSEIADLVDHIRASAILVDPAASVDIVPQDQDDNKFFECAVAGAATYIISGDAKVQAVGTFQGIRVVSPAVFLTILRHGHA